MTHIEPHTSKGQLVALVYGQANVAASQTDVQLAGADASGNTEMTAPWAYEIVGIGYSLSATKTAGTLSVGATVNGTEDADTTVAVADSVTSGYQRVRRGQARGVAGDTLGVEITTNSGFLPTTTDLSVTLYVLAYLEGI